MTLEELVTIGDKLEVQVLISRNIYGKYTVCFERTYLPDDDIFLRGIYGTGNTIAEAVEDYHRQFAGNVMVIDKGNTKQEVIFEV